MRALPQHPPGLPTVNEPARAADEVRVLLIAPSLDILGGQSRQASRLLTSLRSEPGVRIDFLPVNPRAPGALHHLQRIKFVRTVVTSLLFWSKLLVKAPRYDVLHIFSASYYSYLICAAPPVLLGRLLGKKTVLNYRSGEADDHLTNWRLTAAPLIRVADAVVVPSGYLVDVFRKFNIDAHEICNTVDLQRFVFRERAPLRPVFLTSRLLEPLYNVAGVLRAFATIQQRYADAALTVAGEGSERAALEQLAMELGLRNVDFIGPVAYESMPALYDRADVYLNGPRLDNMPATLLECFASGLPVVTTNAGGIPYIVTHQKTGLVVENGDAEAMAKAAIWLLEHQDAAREIARAAHEASQNYTWPVAKQRWVEMYLALARNGTWSRPLR